MSKCLNIHKNAHGQEVCKGAKQNSNNIVQSLKGDSDDDTHHIIIITIIIMITHMYTHTDQLNEKGHVGEI